ncbi:acyl-CoA dehydrogenase [Bacillus thuringiensis serovar kurstaki str. HD-1]|nr:acyl-CoA dehydrogenase [Bacillus thuringiensis serovar kurstaki str. HD-1]
MNFRFNEEQQMMRKMVRDFAQKEIAPFVPSMEQGVFPKEILQKMGEMISDGTKAKEVEEKVQTLDVTEILERSVIGQKKEAM